MGEADLPEVVQRTETLQDKAETSTCCLDPGLFWLPHLCKPGSFIQRSADEFEPRRSGYCAAGSGQGLAAISHTRNRMALAISGVEGGCASCAGARQGQSRASEGRNTLLSCYK